MALLQIFVIGGWKGVRTSFEPAVVTAYYPFGRVRILPFVGLGMGYYSLKLDPESAHDCTPRVKGVKYRGTAGTSYFLSNSLSAQVKGSYPYRTEQDAINFFDWVLLSDHSLRQSSLSAGFVVYSGRR